MDNQQRTRELELIAAENNWSFAPNADISSIPALQKFEFQTGEKRKVEKIENLIEGKTFKVFDAYWKTEYKPSDAFGSLSHKDMSAQNIQQQTMFLFDSKDLELPKFHVYPANSVGLIDKWLDKNFRRIAFSAYPEFEKRWSVRGETKDFFSEKVIEFYQKSDIFWTFATENCLFIYQPNILIHPAEISAWIKRNSILSNLFEEL